MKPPPLRYRRPAALAEAMEMLAEPDAKALAGGQSLVPLLNLRLAHPTSVVDINRLPDMRSIDLRDGEVHVGALVRHADVESSVELARSHPLLTEIAAGIGYRAIRNRGTVCGSLAHADPAAEWPVALLGLGGRVRVASRRGVREIAADDLFAGFLETSLVHDELITEAIFPVPAAWRWGFYKFARKAGEFSLCLAVAGIQADGAGRIQRSRIAVGGAADRPVRLAQLEAALHGLATDDLPDAKEVARLSAELDPREDIHGGRDYKLALAATVCLRALRRACT